MKQLREANIKRQAEWTSDVPIPLSFWAVELAGECGEACNIIKKLERERMGIRGSRATVDQLAEELADVIICADLIALDIKVNIILDKDLLINRSFPMSHYGSGLAAAVGMVCHNCEQDGKALPMLLLMVILRTRLLARYAGIDIDVAVRNKFNKTSANNNLKTMMQ